MPTKVMQRDTKISQMLEAQFNNRGNDIDGMRSDIETARKYGLHWLADKMENELLN